MAPLDGAAASDAKFVQLVDNAYVNSIKDFHNKAADVDAVHQAALDAGAEVLHAPRIWPEYHPGYYAVFVRDLDGHNVEAVHHLQNQGSGTSG